MSNSFDNLLSAIVWKRLLTVEQAEVEQHSGHAVSESHLHRAAQAEAQRDLRQWTPLAAHFGPVLLAAHAADPEHRQVLVPLAADDPRLDAAIQLLVRPGFAGVHTEEREGRTEYSLRMHWADLEAFAQKQGLDLDAMLAEGGR
jgi:hypothetical protein